MNRPRRIPALLAAAVLVIVIATVPELVAPGLLSCAPALLLLGCLWLGRYPGHERIARWISRYRARRSRPPRAALVALAGPALLPCPRGGRLLGAQMAVRPPPEPLGPAACC